MVRKATGARLLRAMFNSGKKQQRSATKLMVSLFGPSKPKAKPKAAVKAKVKAKVTAKAPVKASAKAPAVVTARTTSNTRAPAARAAVKPLSGSSVPPVPPSSPAPGRWLAAQMIAPPGMGSAAARRMNYWLYLPHHIPEAAAQRGLPLLLMLHGCQQTATQFAQGTRMNQLAEKMGYAVLYPQQLVSTQAQRCWKWYDKATQEGGGDVPLIVGMVHKVMAQYAIDRTRIYAAGISAGAGMADIVALNHPDLFAAVGLHSGPVFGAGHSTMGALGVMHHGAGMRAEAAAQEVLQRQPRFPGMPAILIQGEGDNVVRPVNQIQLARQSLLLNGLPLLAEPKVTLTPAGRGGSRNPQRVSDFYAGRKLLVRVAQIAHLEHAWSGGDPALAFNAKAGPDAGKMMLEFFARHQRRPRLNGG